MHQFTSPISIPNILSLLRILLTPAFVILLLRDMYGTALLVFAVAGISDGLDGLIARYMNQRTALGAYLDPAADKLLITAAYVALALLGIIPAWLSVVVIARDVIIVLGLAILTLTQKKYDIHPTLMSKCTTATQLLMIFMSLYDPSRSTLPLFHLPLVWCTAVVTILSGFQYIYIGMNILQTSDPADTTLE